jgi:hypothetical protein
MTSWYMPRFGVPDMLLYGILFSGVIASWYKPRSGVAEMLL